MTKEYRVNVYDSVDSQEIVSRVRYNQDLDYWNGSNWQNGGTGMHKGITKLKDGRFVIIYGTQWDGDRDYALIVQPKEALQEILRSQHLELLEMKKYVELKALALELGITGDTEFDDDEEI
jgi:hypothetical protein